MNFINCHLLHWSYEKHSVPEVPEHIHSYYQIELCVRGTIKFIKSRSNRHLHSGEWMLIPPGTPHSMIYEGRDLEYYSFKFEVNNYDIALKNELIFQAANTLSDWVIDSLSKQRPPDRYLYMPINENRAVLEALLLSMFQQALSPIAAKPAMPEILRNISDMISEEGAQVNIQRAAERLLLNTAQLKYRCRSALQEYAIATGRKMTLKEFFDRELMKQIDRFLFYSDLQLSDIAEQTMFNNIYTFSRFVKRLTGETPSHRRANKNQIS
ncbi:MAG: AraC family ligand binding domain-containing protein [Lentisphaeria bacterium]|nr:AraC family ligand binding domain-containing protein [Lentisphaeria bacterium]